MAFNFANQPSPMRVCSSSVNKQEKNHRETPRIAEDFNPFPCGFSAQLTVRLLLSRHRIRLSYHICAIFANILSARAKIAPIQAWRRVVNRNVVALCKNVRAARFEVKLII